MTESKEKFVLKIYFVDSYRTLAFENDIIIKQAIVFVKQKLNLNDKDYQNYGLFVLNEGEEKNSQIGFWLNENISLNQSGISVKSHVEFRSKNRFLKVTNIARESIKTMLVDETIPLKDLIGVEENPEYSLQTTKLKDNKLTYLWMDMSKSLCEQYLSDENLVIYRKKFHVTDSFLESHSPNDLHMLYLECKHSIISGLYMTSLEQALAFSALQMQITFGNYDPLVHIAGFLPLLEYLPPNYSSMPYIEEDVYRAHRKLKDTSSTEVKQRYIKQCLALPTYGITYRNSRETSPTAVGSDCDLIVGVNCDAFFTLHIETKDVISRTPLLELTAFGARGKFLTAQFSNRSREFLFENDMDAQQITLLLAGYINFKKNKRKEHFAQNLFSRTTNSRAPIAMDNTKLFHSPTLTFSNVPLVGVLTMNGVRFEFENSKSPSLSN